MHISSLSSTTQTYRELVTSDQHSPAIHGPFDEPVRLHNTHVDHPSMTHAILCSLQHAHA